MRLLEEQESPLMASWDTANMRERSLRNKSFLCERVGLSSYSDRWISPEGELQLATISQSFIRGYDR